VNFLTIQVMDYRGFVYKNVTVIARSWATNMSVEGFTTTEGIVTFQLPNGMYDVYAYLDDGTVLYRAIYSPDSVIILRTAPETFSSTVVAFLTWCPIWIIPMWLWLIIIACIIIVAAYLIFKSH